MNFNLQRENEKEMSDSQRRTNKWVEQRRNLQKQLESEQEVISKQKDFKNVIENIIKIQEIETFCKEIWRGEVKKIKLEYVAFKSDKSTDNDHLLIENVSTDESYSLKEKTIVDKKTLKKLNEIYGPTEKVFVMKNEKSNKTEKVEKANISHFSNKQLKEKLEKIKIKTKAKNKKKNNINDNIGTNKHNNYTRDKYAPRKISGKCGSVNHLSINCKSNIMQNSSIPLPAFDPIVHMSSMFVATAQNAHAL